MEELNTPIFAQAKVEYTAQLVDMLYPHMFDGVKSIYDESKLLYGRKKMPILLIFRELLEKVPIWNSEIIDSECSRIVSNSSCDYIDDLITAVFISHTKILTSIGPNKSFQKINVTIPKTSTFVHKCYINTARELWKNPYLFNENVPGHEFQKNNKEIEEIIKKCIENTIRNSLPIKDILKEHLEGETDSILNQKETLKQMLREELSNFAPQNIQQTHTEQSGGHKDEEFILVDEEEKDSPEIDKLLEENVSKSDIPTLSSIINNEDKIIDSGPTMVKEEDNISDLQSKINDIVTKEKDIQNELNNIENSPEEQSMSEKFPASDDPTDAQVEKACNDIVVNDITIPVDVPGETPSTNTTIPITLDNSTSNPVVEIKYDNVDITNDKKETVGEDKLKKFMTNMQAPNEEVNVVKSDVIATPILEMKPIPQPEPEPQPQPAFSFDSLYPNMNNNSSTDNSPTNNNTNEPTKSVNDPIVKPLEIIEENKSVNNPTINIPQEPKSPRKEMVSVKNEDDIDETSSLANFFDDMKKIVEDKGIKVEQNNDKMFTLFEDANEVEK
jgi:hypothetical protein